MAIMVRYEVEGDKNMPFNLSKIIIVSTAEGQETEGEKKWNFNIFQNNDVYIYLDKNENYWGEDKIINTVTIENINIAKAPAKGKIQAFMPNSLEGRLFNYTEDYMVDKKLEFSGADVSNPQTLEIGRNGGNLLISFSNTGLGMYSSDEDEEITHDGTLLNRIEVSNEDITFEISFDLVISVNGSTYRGNISLQLPCGDIIENGTANIEKTDMSDVIFKREW